MTTNSLLSRRQMLGALAAAGMGGFAAPSRAAVTDYKAIVCINLAGGNDGNNTIVPLDDTRYTRYRRARSAAGLALSTSANTLLRPRTATTRGVDNPIEQPFAFHSALTHVDALFRTGRVAMMLNCGNLRQPLTKSQYRSGQNVPPQLFSHPDQNQQAQVGTPTGAGSGWGGRLLDALGTGGVLDAVAVNNDGMFVQGEDTRANVIPVDGSMQLPGLTIWPQSAGDARREALVRILKHESGNMMADAANKSLLDAMELAKALRRARNGTPLATAFPTTDIGRQLRLIAQLIANRAIDGPGRQVYMATMGSFDTHGGQSWQQANLLGQLSAALGAFQAAMAEVSLENKVTSFTLSEFGRDLQANSSGTDHAWGSHHFVVGGAVRGGLYGNFPDMELGGGDDATGRGAWIPRIGMQQVGATIGRWFGASASQLRNEIFRGELGEFARDDLGFLRST